mmetsp:Transcript_89236/g.178343  ORF Transcript_89236/g.178343 Transcript_89236/m.178343 type:complete len:300 (-) Transcript_89236:411-1310(-)
MRRRLGLYFFVFSANPSLGSWFDTREATTLDAVRQVMLQALWDEPSDYSGSGAKIPDDWRAQFQSIVVDSIGVSDDGAKYRKMLLEHISYRSAVLINSLPDGMKWTESTLDATDLKEFRIVGDDTWNDEFSSRCLTVGEVAKQLQNDLEGGSDFTNSTELKSPTVSSTSSHRERLLSLWSSRKKWPRFVVAVAAVTPGSTEEASMGRMTILDGNHRAILLYIENSMDAGQEFCDNAVRYSEISSSDMNARSGVHNPAERRRNLEPVRFLLGVFETESGTAGGEKERGRPAWKFARNCKN